MISSIRTLKLTIAYDGTDFAGWQRQATARTVQASIEDALAPIEGRRVVLTGAGRTDAGVHAAGQVASVALNAAISTADLRRALNATLAEDVRILDIAEVREGFNARFDARCKTYRYAIVCEEVMAPELRRYAWHVGQPLDIDAMNAAAAMLVGEQDFSGFQAAGSDVKTTIRNVIESGVIVRSGTRDCSTSFVEPASSATWSATSLAHSSMSGVSDGRVRTCVSFSRRAIGVRHQPRHPRMA